MAHPFIVLCKCVHVEKKINCLQLVYRLTDYGLVSGCYTVKSLPGFFLQIKLLALYTIYLASTMYWATGNIKVVKVFGKSTFNINESLVKFLEIGQFVGFYMYNIHH